MKTEREREAKLNVFEDLRRSSVGSESNKRKLALATHRSNAACCVIVAFNGDFDCFKILFESQLLDVIKPCIFSPVFPVNGCDSDLGQVRLDYGVQF